MIVVVRWTAFILELGGLYFTGKLSHEGKFGAAFLFLLFDTAVVLVFVMSHCLVEKVLDKYNNQNKRRGSKRKLKPGIRSAQKQQRRAT